MNLAVQFDSNARTEFLNAVEWYERERAGLGSDFFDEVCEALHQISVNPDLFCKFAFSTRRYVLARFPYCIVYRQVDSGIWVMAVAHTSRRPGYWKERF
jgi:toxin ParE1/3/4